MSTLAELNIKTHALNRILKYLLVPLYMVVGLIVSNGVHARGQYLDWWGDYYPNSSSDDAGCQLCHQMSGGQNGWNRYGWTIRPQFLANRIDNGGNDELALIETLEDIEFLSNSDSTDDYIFLDEIRYNTQPGWVEGGDNTINFRPEENEPPIDPLENQSPPTFDMSAVTEIDLNLTVVADPILGPIPTGGLEIELYDVASDLSAPVTAKVAPGINGSLFVAEQSGKIIRVDLATGAKTSFFDVSSDLETSCNECGLLGLAFHPQFASNGLFYTYQSEEEDSVADFSTSTNVDHQSKIVEYRVSDPSCNSFISKQKTLLVINQPQGNHNGGDLAFDSDGYLYISLGDGGGADDQGTGHGLLGNSRNKTTALGSILRIDVDGTNSSNGKYGIPGDNPFLTPGDEGVDEIFAYGFRNPYRMSFDMQNDDLYVGDVGQNKLEEIDLVVSGGNYGWNWKEGSFNFIDPNGPTSFVTNDSIPGIPNDLIDPVVEYDHDEGISVTGGYVYRGDNVPGLDGKYVFADYRANGSKRLLYFDTALASPVLNKFIMVTQDVNNVTGFGQDVAGEMYVLTNTGFGPSAKLRKIMAPNEIYSSPDAGEDSAQCPPSDELCIPIKASNGNIALICL